MKLTDEQRARFHEDGFLVLRGILARDEVRRYFAELGALLRASFGQPHDGRSAHWVPATDRYTPFAASLLADARFRETAGELLERPVIGEGTDASFYAGDTPWHHDAVHPGMREAVKFTLYGEELDATSGALRFVPGSHQGPLHAQLTKQSPASVALPDSPFAPLPVVTFEAKPGDAVVFDVRTWHGAFGGALRIAGSLNYRIDPRTPQEVTACRSYFARSHRHLRLRYDAGVKLYPEFWRSLPDVHHARWVARLTELGVIDAPVPSLEGAS